MVGNRAKQRNNRGAKWPLKTSLRANLTLCYTIACSTPKGLAYSFQKIPKRSSYPFVFCSLKGEKTKWQA
jgi:hypothetical protein